jgi:hypothetical protein
MATAQKINIGESVGIIAAQSIGEPGTQLLWEHSILEELLELISLKVFQE